MFRITRTSHHRRIYFVFTYVSKLYEGRCPCLLYLPLMRHMVIFIFGYASSFSTQYTKHRCIFFSRLFISSVQIMFSRSHHSGHFVLGAQVVPLKKHVTTHHPLKPFKNNPARANREQNDAFSLSKILYNRNTRWRSWLQPSH